MNIKNYLNTEHLSDEQHAVTQNHQTEPPFSGKYLNNKKEGIYECVVCNNKLFSSVSKYDSKTGWPSFFEPISSNVIGEHVDRSFSMIRTEVHCLKCKAHLGHVFPDGPQPTGLRYCINSLSLIFKENRN